MAIGGGLGALGPTHLR